MYEPARVFFVPDHLFGHSHRVTISAIPATPAGSRLLVKDRGAVVTGHWRWNDAQGCLTDPVSDLDGSFPATCTSSVPITGFDPSISESTRAAEEPDRLSIRHDAVG